MTVSVALTAIYVIFAVSGLIFTAVCLIFTIMFRKKRQDNSVLCSIGIILTTNRAI